MDNKLFQIRKDTDKGQSTVSWNGMEISGVNMSDTKSMKENINQAMDSMQFLKDSGLDIFTTDIPKIIDAVNNRASRKSGEKIDITDGISVEEGFILLESIGKIINEVSEE